MPRGDSHLLSQPSRLQVKVIGRRTAPNYPQLYGLAQILSLLLPVLRGFQGCLNRISAKRLEHLFGHSRICSEAIQRTRMHVSSPYWERAVSRT